MLLTGGFLEGEEPNTATEQKKAGGTEQGTTGGTEQGTHGGTEQGQNREQNKDSRRIMQSQHREQLPVPDLQLQQLLPHSKFPEIIHFHLSPEWESEKVWLGDASIPLGLAKGPLEVPEGSLARLAGQSMPASPWLWDLR